MEYHQFFTYENGTDAPIILTVEPWAEEYTLPPKEIIEITGKGGVVGSYFEIEQTTEGITVYGWEGSVVFVTRNGKEIAPDCDHA